MQHCVGRMQQSWRLKAQLPKALRPNRHLLSMTGPQRKTKPSGEHSSSSIYCRVQKNKLEDKALYCLLDPKPATSTSQAVSHPDSHGHHTLILQQDPRKHEVLHNINYPMPFSSTTFSIQLVASIIIFQGIHHEV